MSDDDKQSIAASQREVLYKQKIEELQKKLKEEQEIRAELLRRALDVLQSIKQLREMYNKEKEEKESLVEKIQTFQKSGFLESRGERDGKEWSEVNDTTHELDRLRVENEEIRRTLSKKPSVEGGTITDPELLEAITIHDKLLSQLSELTEAKNDLQYLREEQAKSIQSADDIPPFGQTNLCFVMSVEEAKGLANKIKKLQVELWDLEISHQQLQVAHAQAGQELEHLHSGAQPKHSTHSGSDILSHNTNRDIYREMALMEDDDDDTEDDRRALENKYYDLVSAVTTLREQAQTFPVEQGGLVLDSFYQLMSRLVEEKKGLAVSGLSSDLDRLEFSKIKKQKTGKSGSMDDNEKRMSLKPLQATKVAKELKEKHRPKTARNSSSSKSKKKKESKEKVDY